MTIRTFGLGPLQTNCFVVTEGDQALVVDPGGEPAPVLEYLNGQGLNVSTILLTHFHFDHTYGAAALSGATNAPILASPKDAYLLETELGAGGFMGFPAVTPYDWKPLEPGTTEFLGQPCKVMLTPGHTLGSLSFYFPKISAVFVGDLIFFRSIGRTDFPGGDTQTLLNSVTSNIFPLPDDTTIYSGHGETTSVGEEKLHNPYFNQLQR